MIDYHTYNSKESSCVYAPTPFNMKDFLSVAVAADTSNTPIVDVSAGFLRLTGYSREAVVGQNCRFLQGKKTDPAVRKKIRAAIKKKETFSGFILNYRQSGDPFWQYLNISYHSIDPGVGFFIGVQSAFGLFSENYFDIKNQGDTIQVYVRPNLDPDYKDLIFTLDTQTLCEYTR